MKKILNALLILVISICLLNTNQNLSKAQNETNGDGDITTEKTAVFTDEDTKENLEIRITEAKEQGLKKTPKILFLGSLCSNHGLTKAKVEDSLFTVAKFGDVDYHLFKFHRDYTTKEEYSNSLSMNETKASIQTKLSGVELGGSMHCTTYEFAKIIKNATLSDNPSGSQKHYDYIVMEFDGLRMGYFYKTDFEDKTSLDAAASVLKDYYKQNRVAWIISNDVLNETVWPYDYNTKESYTITSSKKSDVFFPNEIYMDNDNDSLKDTPTDAKRYRYHVRETMKLLAPEDLVNGEVPDVLYYDSTNNKITDDFKTFRSRICDYNEQTGTYTKKASGSGIWVYYTDIDSVLKFLRSTVGKSTVNITDVVPQGFSVVSIVGQYKADPSKDVWTNIATGSDKFKYTTKEVTYDTDKKGTQVDAAFDMWEIYGVNSYNLLNASSVRLVITCKPTEELELPQGQQAKTVTVKTNVGDAKIEVSSGVIPNDPQTKESPTVEIDCIDVTYAYKGTVPSSAVLPATKTVKKNHEFTSTAPDTTTGYTFGGWNTNEGCTDKYTDKTVLTADLNLYGKWTPITYQVKFNGNGNTSGTMSNQTLTYDKAENLSANGYSKTGYALKGWSEEAEGKVKYAAGASVKNLKDTQDAVLNLYAIWEPITYQVKFNSNGATSGTMSNQTLTYDKADNLSANKYSRTGYTFKGWSKTTGGTVDYTAGESVKNLKDTQDAVLNLYAVWEPITYKVKYDKNGGSGTDISDSTFTYDSTTDVIKSNSGTYTKTGYTYKGWDKNSKAITATYEDGATGTKFNFKNTQDATQTLYAVWSPITYQVRFNGNDATSGSMNNQTLTYDKTEKLSTNKFSRPGYTFKGWSDTPEGEVKYAAGASVKNLKNTQGDILDLYAVWEIGEPVPPKPISPKDESCEKVIGPTWHWNNNKGVCEEVSIVSTSTR